MFVLWINPTSIKGQSSIEAFGKNRVQYKNLKWHFITTKHFYIYYYQDGAAMANNAAVYAEEELPRLARILGYPVNLREVNQSKITLILYNTLNDKDQSNIGIKDYFLLGGETDLIKKKVEIAFPGTQQGFRKELTKEISALLLRMMMYGGSIKERMQNTYLLSLPNWFTSGLAQYLGYGDTPEMRDAVKNSRYSDLKRQDAISLSDAETVGQSIWSFIISEYGSSSVSNILNLTRLSRNVEVGISSSLGVGYTMFVNKWKQHYKNDHTWNPEVLGDVEKIKRHRKLFKVALNTKADKLLYSENQNGKYKVFVKDLESGDSRKIFTGGNIVVKRQANYRTPLLGWKGDNIAVVSFFKQGYPMFYFFDLANNKKYEIPFKRFEEVIHFDISANKKSMVLCAVHNGRNDLYIYEFKTRKLTPLTSDIYDDLYPVFVDNDQKIAFVSNREQDSIIFYKDDFKTVSKKLTLYVLTVGEQKLKRYSTNGRSFSELTRSETGEVFAIQNQGDVSDLVVINISSNSYRLVTQEISRPSSFSVANKKLCYSTVFDFDDYLVNAELDLNKLGEPIEFDAEKIPEKVQERFKNIEDIDVALLKFDSEVTNEGNVSNSETKNDLPVWVAAPVAYQKLFAANEIVSTFLIDQLRGTGVLFEVNMSDLMGDHAFKTGMFSVTDLKTSNLYIEYEYLKKRQDFRLRYDKQSMYLFNGDVTQRYNLNQFDIDISHPLDVTSRVSFNTGVMQTRKIETVLGIEDNLYYFQHNKISFVYDNTVVKGMNKIQGTRLKAYCLYNIGVSDSEQSFGKFKVDFRNYQKVVKDIVWASRFSGGSFFGQSKKNFLLGGIDNWLFSNTAYTGNSDDPLYLDLEYDNTSIIFNEYATAMRGFRYNERFGSNYMLLNTELRIPLTNYLTRGPVSSPIVNNLQLVGFLDVGTAWTGGNPFNKNNSYNTIPIEDGDFSGFVVNYRNPLLMGYGFGARTLLFGYYVKLDIAWGVEDFQRQSARAYLTFGYDF